MAIKCRYAIHLATLLTVITIPAACGIKHLRAYDRNHLLKKDTFNIVMRTEQIPNSVVRAFVHITRDSAFSMANPGEKFQVTDVIDEAGLSDRRLIFAGIASDHCVLHYEMGGIGHAYYLLLFRLKGSHATFVWGATLWVALDGLVGMRSAILHDTLDDRYPYLW
jgi:hypothetical protein